VGSTVIWTNTDGQTAHRVISNLFDSNDIQPHTTFSYTFNDPGSFQYHDLDPSKKGTINVG
jgi:plastocyanin